MDTTAYTFKQLRAIAQDVVKAQRKARKGSRVFLNEDSTMLIVGNNACPTLQVVFTEIKPNGETWNQAHHVAI